MFDLLQVQDSVRVWTGYINNFIYLCFPQSEVSYKNKVETSMIGFKPLRPATLGGNLVFNMKKQVDHTQYHWCVSTGLGWPFLSLPERLCNNQNRLFLVSSLPNNTVTFNHPTWEFCFTAKASRTSSLPKKYYLKKLLFLNFV